MSKDLTPRDVGPGPLDPVTDDRDNAPGTLKAPLPTALAHRKSTAAQVMTEQFHRSGLPAEIEVEEVAPEGVEPVKVVRP